MALDALVIAAAITGLIATSIALPFAVVTEVGNVLFVIGGAGAIVAAGGALLAALFVVLTAFGVAIPI
jgi:hypothetical protein